MKLGTADLGWWVLFLGAFFYIVSYVFILVLCAAWYMVYKMDNYLGLSNK